MGILISKFSYYRFNHNYKQRIFPKHMMLIFPKNELAMSWVVYHTDCIIR